MKIPMVITPHLIGKQAQQDDPTVYSLEQTQRQQQHGVITCSFGMLSWVPSDFFSDIAFSSAGFSSIGGFIASISGSICYYLFLRKL